MRMNKLLDDKIEVKINSKEKLLFEKYAKIKGIDLEELMLELVRHEIDEFIKG